jgi:hypothetical protein
MVLPSERTSAWGATTSGAVSPEHAGKRADRVDKPTKGRRKRPRMVFFGLTDGRDIQS